MKNVPVQIEGWIRGFMGLLFSTRDFRIKLFDSTLPKPTG